MRILRFRGSKNAAYRLRDSLDGCSVIGTAPVGGAGSTYVTLSAATAGDVAVLAIVTADDQEAAAVTLTERLLADAYARL